MRPRREGERRREEDANGSGTQSMVGCFLPEEVEYERVTSVKGTRVGGKIRRNAASGVRVDQD